MSGSAARVASRQSSVERPPLPASVRAGATTSDALTILIVVPTLQAGTAELGCVELVRILSAAGHRTIVMSRGGRLERDVAAAGGEFIFVDAASKNPAVMLRNAAVIARVVRQRRCDVIHAHGRAPAWSAYVASRLTRVPFVTSWYKGFRDQHVFKRLYNSVMARGDRVVAVSDQIAELINERYRIPFSRIDVVPASIDVGSFDPSAVSAERIDAMRRIFGVTREQKVILVVGRIVRRKGHHIVVQAAQRLRDMGLKDFVCVFVGEDQGESRYTGELWDQVLATGASDVVRLIGAVDDMPAAYLAATVVVSAATQPEGLQRAILEAQAMARPVVVSDLGAGPEVVLAPPAVPDDRITGLRFSAGDDAALATALLRLFSMPEVRRQEMGARGREWVVGHFNAPAVAELTLKFYAGVARPRKSS